VSGKLRVLLPWVTILTLVFLPSSFAQQSPPPPQGPTTTFAPIIEKVAPTVVTIFTTQKISRNSVSLPDELLRQFFGGEVPSRRGDETLQGLGSGVIVSPDGYILTASHVIGDADQIMIGLGTALRKYKARKIGTDPGTDVGLLKVDEKSLTAITFADSDKARAGDVVLAMGNPFGLRQTATMGIISAVSRGGVGITDYENFIQTDAAINMGNSGGALVDTEGKLIGINSAILSRTGGNQGIGFAIPSNIARDVMKSLREKGKVIRGYIGVAVQTLTPDLADALKLNPDLSGALVGEITPKSPAEKAGIKAGDVITSINGKKVEDARELRLMIGSMVPGAKVRLELDREGQKRNVDVDLVEMPAAKSEASPTPPSPPAGQPEASTVLGGVAIASIDEDVRQSLEIPNEVHGEVIAAIDPDSAAAQAGLRAGDVIEEVNKEPINSANDLVVADKKLKPNDKTLLRVWSHGRSGYVVLQPPQ